MRPHPEPDHSPSHRLPRGYLAACLLMLIGQKPAHGYELRDDLADLCGEGRDLGQLYRVLRAMERDGLVVSCWQDSETGPARRTYHLSDRGTSALHELALGIEAGHRMTSAFLGRYRAAAPALHASA